MKKHELNKRCFIEVQWSPLNIRNLQSFRRFPPNNQYNAHTKLPSSINPNNGLHWMHSHPVPYAPRPWRGSNKLAHRLLPRQVYRHTSRLKEVTAAFYYCWSRSWSHDTWQQGVFHRALHGLPSTASKQWKVVSINMMGKQSYYIFLEPRGNRHFL